MRFAMPKGCVSAGCGEPRLQRRGIRGGLRGGERGSEVFEVSLVMTFVLLPLLLGLFSMGRAYSIYSTANRAVREGARLAAARSCAACGNAVPNVSDVESAVMNAMSSASVQTSQVSIPSSCTASLSSKICYQRDIVLNSGDTPQELGVVVSFNYAVPLDIPFTSLRFATVNITPHVQMREEN